MITHVMFGHEGELVATVGGGIVVDPFTNLVTCTPFHSSLDSVLSAFFVPLKVTTEF